VADDKVVEVVESDEKLSRVTMTDYAIKLSLIEGHLWVANELVIQGHLTMGSKHSKHPAQEVYKELTPLFKKINSIGFADELQRMATHLKDEEIEEFRSVYLEVVSAIKAIYPLMALTVAQELEISVGLLEQAHLEYAVGVLDGDVLDLQEYQDAWGFTNIAEERLRSLEGKTQSQLAQRELHNLKTYFANAYQLWPSLIGNAPITSRSEPLAELIVRLKEVQGSYSR
jgi:hypothetical protein